MLRPDEHSSTDKPRCVQASRSLILNAAAEVFASEGFQQATLRQIASRAGRDAALVLRYFGDKAGLFEAVVHAELAQAPDLPCDAGFGPALADRLFALSETRLWRLVLAAREAPIDIPWALVLGRAAPGLENDGWSAAPPEALLMVATCLGFTSLDAGDTALCDLSALKLALGDQLQQLHHAATVRRRSAASDPATDPVVAAPKEHHDR